MLVVRLSSREGVVSARLSSVNPFAFGHSAQWPETQDSSDGASAQLDAFGRVCVYIYVSSSTRAAPTHRGGGEGAIWKMSVAQSGINGKPVRG